MECERKHVGIPLENTNAGKEKKKTSLPAQILRKVNGVAKLNGIINDLLTSPESE